MLQTVKQVPLLQDLSEEQLELIVPLLDVFTCPAGCPIFEQDDKAVYLYLLVSGTVAIQYKPYDGKKITLTRLHAGDAFGWSSVIGGPAYTSSIFSETEIEAVRIHGKVLRKLCREYPELGHIILDRLAEAVSGRWKDSREQVHAILHRKIHRKELSK